MQSSSLIYRIPVHDLKRMGDSVRYVLGHRRYRLLRSFWTKQIIGIKSSCSELQSDRQAMSGLIRACGISLMENKLRGFVCDTSKRHKHISSNALDHIDEAYCDCPDEISRNLPFFMLDGINGNYEYVSKTAGDIEVCLAGEIGNIDGMLVLSFPFEHELCGMAGALYNIGAGLASKRGKIKQHTKNKPQVTVEKCYACRRCVHECPVKAISMNDRHVVIDEELCIDCGKCVEIARYCGISYDWNADPDYFIRRIIEHASGAMEILSGKTIFINVVPEYEGKCGSLLISRDPLAVDLAGRELGRKKGHDSAESTQKTDSQMALAADMGLGSKKFFIETISY